MKPVLSIGTVLFALVVLYPVVAFTNSGGTPPERTGAPGEMTCGEGSTCHHDGSEGLTNLNTGSGVLSIEGNDTYAPGETVTFVVRLAQAGISRFGFQATVKDGSNAHIGQLELVDAVATRLTGSGNAYITHRSNGTFHNEVAAWEFRWVAPSGNAGPVTIYAAGNATNSSGSSSGDQIYTTSKTLMPGTGTAAESPSASPVFMLHPAYPNPATARTTIAYDLIRAAPVTLGIYDSLGRQVRRVYLGVQGAGRHEARLDIQDLAAGVYLYEIRTASNHQSHMLIVER